MNLSSTWSSPPSNYRELVTLYEKQFHAAVANGIYVPWVQPYRSFGVYILILYLLLPPSKSKVLYYARYTVFALAVYWCGSVSRDCRSPTVATGYGVGLIDAWSMLWLASLIIFNDGRNVFRRIEREEVVLKDNASADNSVHHQKDSLQNGVPEGQQLRARSTKSSKVLSPRNSGSASKSYGSRKCTWQHLPHKLSNRIDWVADLITNFRGTGWSHQIASIPGPPPTVLQDLGSTEFPPKSPCVSPTGNIRYDGPTSLLRYKFMTLILGYLALDALKVVMMLDPYFWGLITLPPPSYLPTLITSSTILTRVYRLLLSLAGTYLGLNTIFALGPVFFVGIVGPRILGTRAEAWQYPDAYGSYSSVFTKGLAGWWGGWWHQTFRFGFEAPTKWACEKLGWDPKSMEGKTLGLLVAFGCSGCLHACGSYTMWPSTNPLKGPLAFFWLQPVGIISQMLIAGWMKKLGIREKLPTWVRGLGNFVFVHVWMYYTAPLLTDDFAKGGIWLFEPVPVSLLRGLGLGLEGEGWWCWHRRIVGWHWGERWWQSGIYA